jgi:hypothetical protein
MLSNFFFSKIVLFLDNVEKYGGPKQSTDNNIILRKKYEIFFSDDEGSRLIQTLTQICNIHCFFFTATMVTRTRLTVNVVRTSPFLLWTNAVQPADENNTVTDRGTVWFTYWLPVYRMREENFKFIFCEFKTYILNCFPFCIISPFTETDLWALLFLCLNM